MVLRVFLFLSLFIGVVASGCGGADECMDLVCPEAVQFWMVNPDGEPVRVFSGSVTVDGITYEFACNTANPFVEGPVECVDGGVWILGRASAIETYFVTVISDTQGYHSKMVEPEYGVDGDFNGAGCGDCAYGRTELILVE